MEIWVFLAVAAAFSQNMRFALQKRLSGRLGAAAGTAARFVYAAPLALAMLAALCLARGETPPGMNLAFFGYAVAGGLAQISATWLVVSLFAHRNFAAAMAYTKTETLQTALLGAVLLGDRLPLGAWGAIALGFVGVLLISTPLGGRALRGLADPRALAGIASGTLFGLSAVAYRGATLSLEDGDALMRALTALSVVTLFQTVLCLIWLQRAPRSETGQSGAAQLLRAWRPGAWVGLAGATASLCWFAAFALRDAASVRAVGQIEVLFTLALSILMFKERPSRREIGGAVLIGLAIIALVLATA